MLVGQINVGGLVSSVHSCGLACARAQHISSDLTEGQGILKMRFSGWPGWVLGRASHCGPTSARAVDSPSEVRAIPA